MIEENPSKEKYEQRIKKIMTRLKTYPEQIFCVFYCLAGHSMLKDGRQVLITNEFDVSTGFYNVCDYEDYIARVAEHYSNSYQISVSSG